MLNTLIENKRSQIFVYSESDLRNKYTQDALASTINNLNIQKDEKQKDLDDTTKKYESLSAKEMTRKDYHALAQIFLMRMEILDRKIQYLERDVKRVTKIFKEKDAGAHPGQVAKPR